VGLLYQVDEEVPLEVLLLAELLQFPIVG